MSVTLAILNRSKRTRARMGRVTTPHGTFDTPAFMPVGTRGTVKGVLPHLLRATGAQICLGNTYHLLLRPGPALVKQLGGLHAFMNWNAPILTDSGGYQAFSMADINAVDDEGVTFKSIIDGAMVRLTPESATQTQNDLGADVIMAFDDCPPPLNAGGAGERETATEGRVDGNRGPVHGADTTNTASEEADPRLTRVLRRDKIKGAVSHAERLKIANERTVRWLERCKAAHQRSADQALFGIVQGGTDLEQRSWCAERIANIELPGYAIGGVAVGEQFADIFRVVAHTAPLLPDAKPRYLMGVGYERDLLAAALAGVDMFDCVLPTRNARNANAFTPTGQMRLRNAKFADDPRPVDESCDCLACSGRAEPGSPVTEHARPFSRAYLRHLFMVDEMLGPILLSLHNLRHFQRFMADLRATIPTDDWEGFVRRWPIAAEGLIGVGPMASA